VSKKLVWFNWNASTMSHEARCPDCKQLCGMWTAEAVVATGRGPGPFMPHECAVEREVTGL
jgi:hypothetical protein